MMRWSDNKPNKELTTYFPTKDVVQINVYDLQITKQEPTELEVTTKIWSTEKFSLQMHFLQVHVNL